MGTFEQLLSFDYSGWHLSRCQKPYALLMKFLYLAETASLTFLTSLCDKEWEVKNLWGKQDVISMDALNLSHLSYNECVAEVLLDPYLGKSLFDNALYANNADNLRKLYQKQKTYPLPEFVVQNREKYAYFFPKWCKLKNKDKHYDYECNFTSDFDDYYNDSTSCWMKNETYYFTCK